MTTTSSSSPLQLVANALRLVLDNSGASSSSNDNDVVAYLLAHFASGEILHVISKQQGHDNGDINGSGDNPKEWMSRLSMGQNLFEVVLQDLNDETTTTTIPELQAKILKQEKVEVNLTSNSSSNGSNNDDATAMGLSLQLLRHQNNDNDDDSKDKYLCAQLFLTQPKANDIVKSDRLNQLQQDMIHIADTSFDPVIMINEAGQIVFLNDATETLFQYNRAELLGQNIGKICGGGHGARHQSYIERYLQSGVAHKIGLRREVLACKADGTEFPVALGLKEIRHEHPEEGGRVERLFVSYISDLSQIRQHEEELEFREREAQSFINASFDPMIQIDDKGIIQVVNDSAVHLFGWTRDEFIGANISMICGGEHGPQHDAYLQRYLTSRQKHVIGKKRKVPAKRKDGSEFVIELGVQEVETTKGDHRFCAFIRDLTEANMMRANMMKQQDLIKDTFFGGDAASGSQSEPTTPTGAGPSTRGGRPRRLRGANSSIQ